MRRPPDITIVASLMIAFGLAEVATSFTHNFFGLHTAGGIASTCVGAMIGAAYGVAGLLLLAMRRSMAKLAIVCLVLVIAGRIGMVVTNLYSIDTAKQASGIVVGTAIAAAFAVYIWIRRSAFQP